MRGLKRTGVATAALWAALTGAAMASTPATVMTDPVGDANGLATLGLDQQTAPASDSTRDLTAVKLSNDATALQVAFEQAAPPDLDRGISTIMRFNATVGDCPFTMMVIYQGDPVNGPGKPIALADGTACTGGSWSAANGFSVAVEGSSVVARFPFAGLAPDGIRLAPGSKLTRMSADTRLGELLIAGIGCTDDSCQQAIDAAIAAAPKGPFTFIDRASSTGNYTVVSSVRRRAGSGRTGTR